MDSEFDRIRRLMESLTGSPEMRRLIQFAEVSKQQIDALGASSLLAERAAAAARLPAAETLARMNELYGTRAIDQVLAADTALSRQLLESHAQSSEMLTTSLGVSTAEYVRSWANQVSIPESLSAALELLASEPSFIGHFEFPSDEESIEPEPEQPEPLAIPEEVEERLVRVEFLPLRVIERIQADPRLMRGVSDRQFEELVAELLHGLGFEQVTLTPRTGDGGRDVIATQRLAGIPILLSIECKRYAEHRHIGPGLLRALLGTVVSRQTASNVGVLVTTSSFTSGARELFVGEPRLDGKDFDDVVEWINDYIRRQRGQHA